MGFKETMSTGLRKCSCCGKQFLPSSLHMYKAKGKYQCSYTCYRKEGGDSGKYSRSKSN